MDLNRNSLRDDGVADLYRGAYALAIGKVNKAWWFVTQAENKLGCKFEFDRGLWEGRNLFWAEKLMDKYYRIKVTKNG